MKRDNINRSTGEVEKFKTKFNSVPNDGRVMATGDRVQRVGYRSPRQQIEAFMRAGVDLQSYRILQDYEFIDKTPDDMVEANPFFQHLDPVDYDRILKRMQSSYNRRHKASVEKASTPSNATDSAADQAAESHD